MSIAVDLADIPRAIAGQIGWCYLLTVTDDGQPRVLAVAPDAQENGSLRCEAGRGTLANAAARPAVTLVFPPATPDAMSLIIDGTATVTDTFIDVAPTWAVMHRPAITPA
jgi:hypothetical protein